jgi:hypothetical protein
MPPPPPLPSSQANGPFAFKQFKFHATRLLLLDANEHLSAPAILTKLNSWHEINFEPRQISEAAIWYGLVE